MPLYGKKISDRLIEIKLKQQLTYQEIIFYVDWKYFYLYHKMWIFICYRRSSAFSTWKFIRCITCFKQELALFTFVFLSLWLFFIMSQVNTNPTSTPSDNMQYHILFGILAVRYFEEKILFKYNMNLDKNFADLPNIIGYDLLTYKSSFSKDSFI